MNNNKDKQEERFAKVAEVMDAAQNPVNAEQADGRMQAVDAVMAQAQQTEQESEIADMNEQAASMPPKIGKEQLQEAMCLFRQYKDGKKFHDLRITENNDWYNNRIAPAPAQKGVERTYRSRWMFNALNNKHADYMDNYPEPSVFAREADDEYAATMLTSIIPCVFENNHFKRTYSKNCWNKINFGTAVYGVVWDGTKLNGLGDISIRKVNILNVFWEPGIENIQDSANLFVTSKVDIDQLKQQYPDVDPAPAIIDMEEQRTEDTTDNSKKTTVYEWYYKRLQNGKPVLHYCKFVGDTVLYATENETQIQSDGNGNIVEQSKAVTGLYDHGKYPFVFDVLFPMEDSPCGAGWIDQLKDAQEQIDVLNNAILINAKQSATRRWAVSNDAQFNTQEFADWTNPIVHVTGGQLSEASAREITSTPLSGTVITTIDRKIDELKETGSNRDFSNGATSSGVTSGAAIAALQEAGNKTSRDMISGSYDAVEEITALVIELIRQFYNAERCFRIVGKDGKPEFVRFSNAQIAPQPQTDSLTGSPMGDRLPIFDIKIKAHKQNPFSRAAQNQDMINFYSMGFFLPQNADQSIACLEMLEIEGKDRLIEKLKQNKTLYDMVQQMQPLLYELASELDRLTGNGYLQRIAQLGLLGEAGNQLYMGSGQEVSGGAVNQLGEMHEDSGYSTVDKAKKSSSKSTEVK